jgi:chemotaxis protein MotB
MIAAGLQYGYKTGQKAAASLCQMPKNESPIKVESAESPIQKDLEARMKQIPGVVALEKEKSTNAFQVVLESDAFFRTGTASLEQRSELTARKIASLLRAFLARTVVEIQGHTDDSPVVRQRNLYRSNWELSVARAASMLHVFEEAGFVKEKLKVVGYGDSRPLVPNRTRSGAAIEENLSKNRRIVLRVIPEGKTEFHRGP